MSKRVLSIIMAATMTLSLFTGCSKAKEETKVETNTTNINKTGDKIVNDKINLKVMGLTHPTLLPADWNESLFWKRMEEKTNINFEFTLAPNASYDEKKNLAFASGDIPDIFFKAKINGLDEVSYGEEQGILLPLQDLIKDYAPNLTKLMDTYPDIKKEITHSNGNIYSLPGIDATNEVYLGGNYGGNLWINNDWLNKVNMKMPTNFDELYKVLVAFRDQDPNGNGKKDEIPMSMVGANAFFKNISLNGMLYKDELFANDKTKKMEFVPLTKEFKDLLKFETKLYNEKLIDNESFSQDSNQLQAKGTGQDQRLGMVYANSVSLIVGMEKQVDYKMLIPFKGDNGQQISYKSPMVSPGKFVITNECKNPEAAMRFIDYFYSEEGGRFMWMGEEGKEYKVNPDGTWEWILKSGETSTDVRKSATMQPGGNQPGITTQLFEKLKGTKDDAFLATQKKDLVPFGKVPLPNLFFNVSDQKRVNSVNADITSYVEQFAASVITGKVDIDKQWGTYENTLKQMGSEDYLKIYQQAYDLYNK